jgi:hypothetical protein
MKNLDSDEIDMKTAAWERLDVHIVHCIADSGLMSWSPVYWCDSGNKQWAQYTQAHASSPGLAQ